MKMIFIPGYRDIYGEPSRTYEELLSDIPSEVIIAIVIMLNNELSAPLSEQENQRRLRLIVSQHFTTEQLAYLNHAYNRFYRTLNGAYEEEVFGRRYLIAMMLKEMNRNRQIEFSDTTPQQQFNIFQAYLLVVDEVNVADNLLLSEANTHPNDRLKPYRMMWTPNITQYEFLDPSNPPFELLKLLCFCKYALGRFQPYLAEYIHGLGHRRLSTFINSFHQVANAASHYTAGTEFSKLNFIRPVEGTDETHLQSLSINSILGTKTITLPDLKKAPLFHNKRDGYMVVDETLYAKKMYRGPFFELRQRSALKNEMSFNVYSGEISKDVIEVIFFQAIIRALSSLSKHEVLCFDDGSDTVPDGYRRKNKVIFLIEFKAYLFPDDLSVNPSFDSIKNYIDQRFIENEKGKPKGVGQLINQLSLLTQNKYAFDEVYVNALHQKKVTVYPIICHNEFHFTLAGINEYLNDEFKSRLPDAVKEQVDVRDVTLINLENLYDLGLRAGNFETLQGLIDRYWKIIANRRQLLKKNVTIDHYLRARSSFDELYHSMFQRDLGVIKDEQGTISRLTELLELKQEELDMEL